MHGLEAVKLICSTHEFRIGWSAGRLFFHLSRASVSAFRLALQEDSKTNQQATKSASVTCFDCFPWQAIVLKSEPFYSLFRLLRVYILYGLLQTNFTYLSHMHLDQASLVCTHLSPDFEIPNDKIWFQIGLKLSFSTYYIHVYNLNKSLELIKSII